MRLVLVLLATASTGVFAGGIYKWVDEQGNVHYSQDPQHQSAQEMKIKVPKTSSAGEDTAAAESSAEEQGQQAGDEERATQQQAMNEAAQKQKEAEEKNCQIAMKRLATISAGGRLYEVDEKGERLYWDDNTRQAKLAEAQAHVDKWCGQE